MHKPLNIKETAKQIRARRERLQRRLEIQERKQTLPVYNVIADVASYQRKQRQLQLAERIAQALERMQVK